MIQYIQILFNYVLMTLSNERFQFTKYLPSNRHSNYTEQMFKNTIF